MTGLGPFSHILFGSVGVHAPILYRHMNLANRVVFALLPLMPDTIIDEEAVA